MERTKTKKIIGGLTLSLALIFFMVLLPYFLGFARTGFEQENIFRQYMIYAYFGGIMLFGILIVFFIEILVKEKDQLYGDNVLFANQGDFPSLKFFGKFSTLQITLGSLIIIIIIAFANFFTIQQNLFQIGITSQQFTPTDNIIFRTFLVSTAENLGLAFTLAAFIFSLRYIARKQNMTKNNFLIFAGVGVLLISAIYGFGLHQLVYGGQETALVRTMAIWTIGGLVTFVSGSFVIFWMFHLINNLFIDLRQVFSDETMLVVFAAIFFITIILYWFLYLRKSKFNIKR